MSTPFTPEEKQTIIARTERGDPPEIIASDLGRNPFGVKSVIQAHRVKLGEIPDPLDGKRGRKPRTLDDGAEAPANGVPNVTVKIGTPPKAAARASSASSAVDGMPLFSGGATRVEVHRLVARPFDAGTGFLDNEHGQVTLAEVKVRFGGGDYEFRAYSDKGSLLGRTREKIAGFSVPVQTEEGAGAYYAPPQTDQRLFDMMERQNADAEKRRHEERERARAEAQLERERLDHQAQMQREWLASQQTMSQQQTAAMFTMMGNMMTAAMQNKGGSLTEMITALGALQELTGGGGDDPITAAITHGPKMIAELKDLAKMRQSPLLQSNPGEAGSASSDPRAAFDVIRAQLIAQGFSQEEAEAELMRCGMYLDRKIKEKQAAKAAAVKRPTPAASPPSAAPPGQPTAAASSPPPPNGSKVNA